MPKRNGVIVNEDGISPVLISRHPISTTTAAQYNDILGPHPLAQHISVTPLANGYVFVRVFATQESRMPIASFFVWSEGLTNAIHAPDRFWRGERNTHHE
ncbi:MAG: hypothetical protein H0X24_11810 [Ktedonobacterales bacterium]|nr:hypothetical protein [Ktedonobacterales bacterium]